MSLIESGRASLSNVLEGYTMLVKSASEHKKISVGLAIYGGLILFGVIASQCDDLDPSGQARKGAGDHNVLPENTPDSDETIMHNGVEILLTINS